MGWKAVQIRAGNDRKRQQDSSFFCSGQNPLATRISFYYYSPSSSKQSPDYLRCSVDDFKLFLLSFPASTRILFFLLQGYGAQRETRICIRFFHLSMCALFLHEVVIYFVFIFFLVGGFFFVFLINLFRGNSTTTGPPPRRRIRRWKLQYISHKAAAAGAGTNDRFEWDVITTITHKPRGWG